MYIYFDTNGTIKEVINDESIRKGSSDYNKIYCYLEGNPDIDDIWYLQKNPDGTLTNEVSFVDNIVTKTIPYDAKRDMKYFQDFEEYQFYVFTLSSSYLSQNGLVVATIRVAENNTLWALGELTFNVQANIVNSDNDITQSQYDYLLLTISSYYSKTEIDNELSLKADKSTTYTKTETDTLLNGKADKTTALTHTGNQLQDYSGNNIYPTLDINQVQTSNINNGAVDYSKIDDNLKNQDAIKVSYLDKSSCEIITGWTNPSNKYLTTQNVTTIDINNPATSVSANDFQYAIIECTAGDKFIINGYDGSNMRCWCFTDASYNKISASMYNTGNQEHRYTVAPTNAKYLIVQRRLSLNNNPSYKFTDLPNNYFAKFFEYGGLNQYGLLTNATDRMRTIDFVDENIEYIETASNNSSFSLWIRFFDADGNCDSSFGNTYNVNYIDFKKLRALYPTYKFKVVLRLDQLGDAPFENIYIHYKNCFVGNKNEILFEAKRLYKTLMFYPYKFKMEAHRGLSNVYPQNTLKAFEGAGKQSFIYGIETDVQMTSDGVLVCFHDDTLDTLTTGTGAVSSYTWANLQNVVYDNTPGASTYPNETIPKFEDYLKICRKYGKVPYIEIKNLDNIGISKLVDLVRTMGFVNRCVFTSFNFTSIKYLSYSAKNDFFIEYMINSGVSITTAISQAKPYNIDAIRVNYNDVTEELINTAHQNGYLIDCWGINYGNTDAYDNMINCGAEGCTCDNWNWATIY